MIFDKLFKKVKAAVAESPADQPKQVDYYAEGESQLEAGNFTKAIELFQAAIDEHPEREDAYLKMADVLLAMDKQKEASSVLYRLLARYPDNARAHEMLKKCQPGNNPMFSQKTNSESFGIDEEFSRINSDVDSKNIQDSVDAAADSSAVPESTAPHQQSRSSSGTFDPHMDFADFEMPDLGLLIESDGFKRLLQSDEYQQSTAKLPIVMGVGNDGKPIVEDLSRMPHLLIAGMTNYGGPTFLNGLLLSILFKNHPSDVRLVLMGDKRLQLTSWPQLGKHFLMAAKGYEDMPVVDDDKNALRTLRSLGVEMDARFDLLKAARARKIDDYNELFCQRKLNPQSGHRYLPRIVVVVFELNGLLNKETEAEICRLAHLAHTVGIHLALLTNQPLLYTSEIQATIPTRLAFKVSRLAESNAILGGSGAQNLKQIGEAIYSSPFETAKHLKCQPVSEDDVDNVIDFISKQRGCYDTSGLPEYYFDDEEKPFDSDCKDEFFDDAARLVVASQFGSTSLLQRKLSLGYNRAGRIIDQLEAASIVGPYNGSKARDVLIRDERTLEQLLCNMK